MCRKINTLRSASNNEGLTPIHVALRSSLGRGVSSRQLDVSASLRQNLAMNPAARIKLLSRATRLTVNLLAFRSDEPGKVAHAGSGVLVSNRLALTARHVMDDFLQLDPRVDHANRPHGGFDPYYALSILSADLHGNRTVPFEWEMESYCRCDYTDISALTVSPRNDKAKLLLETGLNYLEWHLQAPDIGSTVHLFGYPLPVAEVGDGHLRFDGDLEVKTGHVTEIHNVVQSHGYLEFPCYRVDVSVDHSFSGGAVIWNGRLAGIVSAGPSFDDAVWVASLWPFLSMPYSEGGVEADVASLFDSGKLLADDWPKVRGKVRTLDTCPKEGCLRTHLELAI